MTSEVFEWNNRKADAEGGRGGMIVEKHRTETVRQTRWGKGGRGRGRGGGPRKEGGMEGYVHVHVYSHLLCTRCIEKEKRECLHVHVFIKNSGGAR